MLTTEVTAKIRRLPNPPEGLVSEETTKPSGQTDPSKRWLPPTRGGSYAQELGKKLERWRMRLFGRVSMIV